MTDAHFHSGAFGINGIIEPVFDPLLDNLSLSHPLYCPLFSLFQPFSSALVHKITTYKKVSALTTYLLVHELTFVFYSEPLEEGPGAS
jgi:hypothetical protein